MKLFRVLGAVCAVASAFLMVSCANKELHIDPVLQRTENTLLPQDIAESIKTAVMVYSVTTDTEKDLKVTIRYKAPNMYRFDMTSEKTASVICFAGPTEENPEFFKGWAYDQDDGLSELTKEEVQIALRKAAVLPFKRNLGKFFQNSDCIGHGILDAEDCWLVTCEPADFSDRESVCIWISQATNLIRRVEVGDERIIQFFDYTDYDGVMIAKRVYESGPNGVSRTTLISVEWNPELPDSVFKELKPFDLDKEPAK